ncbi:MAG: hypothetical protein RLZZ543_930, partial [Bacteroidota bacterium]
MNRILLRSTPDGVLSATLERIGDRLFHLRMHGSVDATMYAPMLRIFEQLSEKRVDKLIVDFEGASVQPGSTGWWLYRKLNTTLSHSIIRSVALVRTPWWLKQLTSLAGAFTAHTRISFHENHEAALQHLLKGNPELPDESSLSGAESFLKGLFPEAKLHQHEVDVKSEPDWGYKSPINDFECRFLQLNKDILLGYIKGEVNEENAHKIQQCKLQAIAAMPHKPFYAIHHLSHITKVTKEGRRLMEGFDEEISSYYAHCFWIVGGTTRILLSSYRIFAPTKLRHVSTVKSIEEGLKLIRKRKGDSPDKTYFNAHQPAISEADALRREIEDLKRNQEERIQQLAQLIGTPNREIPSGELPYVPEDDPFAMLFDRLNILPADAAEYHIPIHQENEPFIPSVTELMNEDTTLKESNLRAILDNTDDEIYLINSNYELIDYNTNFENNFYARYGVFVEKGRDIFSMMPPEYSGQIKKTRERIDKALQGFQRTYYDKFQLGFYESISEVKLYPIRSNTRSITGVSVFIRDCTEQKRSEDIIHQNQLLLSSINRNIKEGLYRSTPARGMIYV